MKNKNKITNNLLYTDANGKTMYQLIDLKNLDFQTNI